MRVLAAYVSLMLVASLVGNGEEFRLAALEDAVVQLAVSSGDGKSVTAIGSGFVITPSDFVVTAAHLYWQAGTTINEQKGGQMLVQRFSRTGKSFRVPVELIAKDDERDIAIFRFDHRLAKSQWPEVEIKPLSLASKEPGIGDEIAFAGYFGSDPYPILSKGTVAGSTPVEPEQILIDVHVNRGQSGSPVVLLETGEVVGVAVGFVPASGISPGSPPQYSGVSRAAKAEYIKNLISAIR